MNELAFHGCESAGVMFALSYLLFKIRFQVRICLACHEARIEEDGAELTVAAFADEASAFDGGAALMDAAVETNVRDQLFRR